MRKNEKKWSDRVQSILDLVPKCKTLADVGCDHAKISIHLKEIDRVERVIASDLREKPLAKAKENAEKKGVLSDFQFRLCDGLSAFTPNEADAILISGMGGQLMRKVLMEGRAVASSADFLILEPQSDASAVRTWLNEEGFRITDERFVREGLKYYPVIRAEKGRPESKSHIFDKFGPILLQNRDAVLKEFLEERRKHYLDILSAASFQSEKKEEAKERLFWLKEALSDVEKALDYYG